MTVGGDNPSQVSGQEGFQGRIDGVFVIPNRYDVLALSLTEIEGVSEVGQIACFKGERRKILELGRNSTDGKTISTRSCLTGQPVAPYEMIGIEWDGARPNGLIGEMLTVEDGM